MSNYMSLFSQSNLQPDEALGDMCACIEHPIFFEQSKLEIAGVATPIYELSPNLPGFRLMCTQPQDWNVQELRCLYGFNADVRFDFEFESNFREVEGSKIWIGKLINQWLNISAGDMMMDYNHDRAILLRTSRDLTISPYGLLAHEDVMSQIVSPVTFNTLPYAY